MHVAKILPKTNLRNLVRKGANTECVFCESALSNAYQKLERWCSSARRRII